MELDPRSLVVAGLMDAALLGVIALVFASREGATRTIGTWGAAMVTLAIGLGGVAAQGVVPDLVSVALANSVIVGALVLALRSLRLMRGQTGRDALGWGMVALVFVLQVVFLDVLPAYRARVVVISSAMALLFARGALVLHPEVPEEAQRSFRFTEYVLWAAAALTLARAASAFHDRAYGLLAPGMLRASTFLFYISAITSATLGVLWMQIQLLQRDLVRLARVDPLTDVLNRGAFLREFEREVSRAEREGGTFSLAIFDLDRFKLLNDHYGHPLGDQALKAFTEILQGAIRKHDVIGRYGGEEFALLMPNTDEETATRVAERVRREVESRGIEVAGRRIELTVSGGVATFGLDGLDWNSLLSAADTAMYDAKAAGRNQVVSASRRPPGRAAMA
ncbi:MAG TPA: GGDEF domain-containing protein [Burkholderiales bacterium]|nr:GGDEF domain-containing protein [Burkholderiales bacterium]